MITKDIQRKIISYLNIYDCYNLFLTNKNWSLCSKDKSLWKQINYRLWYYRT